jgi:flavin-dependent dehydrogenase
MVEVLIAGAGPAGAIAALMLARAGVRVLIVDRARFPRDKICGDTMNPGALGILARHGLRQPIDRRGFPIHGMLLTGPTGARVRGLYGSGIIGRSLIRRDLDQLLIEAAVAAGAQFQDGVRVHGPIIEQRSGSKEPTVHGAMLVARDGRTLRIPAQTTIAADGRRSTLAFALKLARQPAHPRRWAVGGYFQDVEGLDIVGEMHIRHGHYIGVAPLPGGVVNACYVSASREGMAQPASQLLRALWRDPILRERFVRARITGPVTVLGPMAVDAPRAGVRGLLLAGDAAGFIDPITGDGVRFALRGGELAADTAFASLEHPDRPWHETLTRRRAHAFGGKHRFNRLIRAVVASDHAIRAGTAGATLAPSLLRRIISYAGDVTADGVLPESGDSERAAPRRA